VTTVLRRQTRARLNGDSRDPAVIKLSGDLAQGRNNLYRGLEAKAKILYASFGADGNLMADVVFAQLDADSQAEAAVAVKVLINDFKRRVRSEPGNELELRRLNDVVVQKREVLEGFRKQMVASELQQRVETTSLGLHVKIVDRARLPFNPYWPNKKRIMMLAMLLGPVLGIGLAFLAELLDPTLRSLDDIHRIFPDEPILGTLPLVNKVIPSKSGLRRRWVPVTVASVLALTVGFFVAKETIWPNLGVPKDAIEAVEPAEGAIR
jgi:hypothetical protein